ncbi:MULTISPECIES: hypothetical protein [Idiomarina]|jgi:hypothetical protein|uniref:Uncharacterized protein n=1 Tax=Idiomarina abyssalis TaxID=86102 RepID=A0A8I1GCZ8_9GAMM|nr:MULTISPECIES: hypothetical protein [Idiomarina]RDX34590.1 hypothetical protein DZA32_00050 [Idiomarina sp. HD9-110m-PIT-SAG04]RDX34979.1 hypothetical protein DZA36_01090 [Idiomarina sp. HD9-110m-PIT-SAG05]KPD21616.1 hypothetical protein ADS78_06310 [Idiomarina abyssalis]MAB22376.1 hypothetical protein [Idiomarina sp.]MAB22761.1 hypothetical protein [Idiomarina sp.]|tara:strand:- start:6328 stop:6585 length:258 start_codon:yes stop_codon:yes gene_type:complete
MKALIVSVVSGVMLFSASASAADDNRDSIAAEIQAQIAEISEQGMETIKQSVSDSIQEWGLELFSSLQLTETQSKASEEKSQQTQ